MNKELGCPITLGEYERMIKNRDVICNKINFEQYEWLEYFFDKTKYTLKDCILQFQDGVLWVITNTKNSIKEFETLEGERF